MYPAGFQTWVEVEEVSRGLEGERGPGTSAASRRSASSSSTSSGPTAAYFGQKDAQQVAVLERMVRDLDLELELRVVPTVRDADGLALSSRNVHLSPEERRKALILPRALEAGVDGPPQRDRPPRRRRTRAPRSASAASRSTTATLARWNGRLVLAAAIRVGGTRLIDNVVLEGAPS